MVAVSSLSLDERMKIVLMVSVPMRYGYEFPLFSWRNNVRREVSFFPRLSRKIHAEGLEILGERCDLTFVVSMLIVAMTFPVPEHPAHHDSGLCWLLLSNWKDGYLHSPPTRFLIHSLLDYVSGYHAPYGEGIVLRLPD